MDRLQQLRACAAAAKIPRTPPLLSSVQVEKHTANTAAPPPPLTDTRAVAATLQAFYPEVEKIAACISAVYALMQKLQDTYTEDRQTVGSLSAKRTAALQDDLTRQISHVAQQAKAQLDALHETIETLQTAEQAATAANRLILRIEENQYTHLVLKLTTAMAEYERHQSANEAFYKAQTQRQIKIKYTNPDGTAIDDATAQQLAEQVLENNTTSYIFQQRKDVLASIIETRNDIYRIEQSMRDLNQLFNDLAFLINDQDEQLNLILYNMQRSTRDVEKGRAELKKARKYKRSIRNKIIGTVAVVGTAIGGAVGSAFIP